MNLIQWSWFFLVAYVVLMLAIGTYSAGKIKNGDDFAVARSSYGPLLLALAFAATTASGATFLGIPALAYTYGVPAISYAFLYPVGVYLGVLICLRTVSFEGERFASRSIPEYLGDRYNSEFIRISFAVFSLILLFYLAGQLVAGLVMFENMLGISKGWALTITTTVLLGYVVTGGAHADIITDGVQGIAMLLIAIIVTVLFINGASLTGESTGNINGGSASVIASLEQIDPNLVRSFAPEVALYASPLTLVALVIAHIPLGMLPHIGNKLWALRDPADQRKFLGFSFIFGMILPAMVFAGLLGRVVLGDSPEPSHFNANEIVPRLFIETMPTWLAALLSVTVLAAVMSTADGLVVSASQVFANDIYRRTLLPRMKSKLKPGTEPRSNEGIDQTVLQISRWATVIVLIGSAALAWALIDMNIALLVWIGIGGMTSALAGPLVLGSLWRGVNRQGAIAGMLVGVAIFVASHSGLLGLMLNLNSSSWIVVQSGNPYTCSALGVTCSIIASVAGSMLTNDSLRATQPD